jgi:hypothetical protein
MSRVRAELVWRLAKVFGELYTLRTWRVCKMPSWTPVWETGQYCVVNNMSPLGVDSGYEERQQNLIPFLAIY